MPVWRLRTAQAITAAAAVLAIVGWGLTTGTSYSLVSHFVHMKPTTTVATARPEIGVIVDAPAEQLPALASAFAGYGLHVSFAFDRPPTATELTVRQYGDQPVPQLPHGGLVRWLGTRDQLNDILSEMGFDHHFLYTSSGPSVGQWWLAHRAGGRLIAGAVHVYDHDDPVGHLRAGEVIELSVDAQHRRRAAAAQAQRRPLEVRSARGDGRPADARRQYLRLTRGQASSARQRAAVTSARRAWRGRTRAARQSRGGGLLLWAGHRSRETACRRG